jgi:hypothetical protein
VRCICRLQLKSELELELGAESGAESDPESDVHQETGCQKEPALAAGWNDPNGEPP